MKFSIIVVCLNPGDKLNQTLNSILQQTYRDFEIVVKDGNSKDGSIERMMQDERICLYVERDAGIYDAMNQAVAHARGEYILFMNCGDMFYREDVLENTARIAAEYKGKRVVFYGDTYSEKSDVIITAAPKITGFTCYRNIPCHQACFYAATLCKEKPYHQEYKIRADYDHFLWCFYKARAEMINLQLTVASYEGGGYSESKENRERDKREHELITRTYMSTGELVKYRLIMLGTLAPLRRLLAESKLFSGWYHSFKEHIYQRKAKNKA